jgi:hypothetical protein
MEGPIINFSVHRARTWGYDYAWPSSRPQTIAKVIGSMTNIRGPIYATTGLHVKLHRQARTASHEDFNKLAKYVREVRSETAEARRALKRFESEHPKNIDDSLRQEYQAAVQDFRTCIGDLVLLVDVSATDSDFNLAHRRIIAARRACEVARDALEHHRAEHER